MIDQGLLEEPEERTRSPFAEVIAVYEKHAAKLARRPLTDNRAAAAFYYKKWAIDLGTR